MPLYDYKCPKHGLFHGLATMEKSGEPTKCPTCGTLSARVIMIPPEVLAMAPGLKKAKDRNEEAKHQPIVSTTDSRAEAADRAKHASKNGHGHGHNHKHGSCGCSHEHTSTNSPLKQQLILLPDGSKIFPSQRPWMISH